MTRPPCPGLCHLIYAHPNWGPDYHSRECREVRAREPLHVVACCGWCEISLSAIPDQPVTLAGRRYHPRCAKARLASANLG